MTAGDNSTPATPPPPENSLNGREDGPDNSAMPSADEAGNAQAAPLIKQFGGIRPMAAKLGVPVSTVQGWKQRNVIPASRLPEIEAAAKTNGIVLGDIKTADVSDSAMNTPSPAATVRQAGSVPTSPPPGRTVTPRRGGGLALAVSVVALLVSLGAGAGVWWLSRAPVVAGLQADALPERIERIEDEVASLTSLSDRLTALEGAPAPTALADTVARLEADLTVARTELLDEIERLQAAASRVPESVRSGAPRLDALEQRLATLEAGDAGAESAGGETVARLDKLERSLVDLSDTQSALAAQVAEAAGADAVADLDARVRALAGVRGQLEVLAGQIDEIEVRLTAITAADVVEPRALALVLALQQLRTTVAAGRPFSAELDAARRLIEADSPLAGRLATLRTAADRGVATVDQLRAAFPNVARALLQAALADNASAGLFDRVRARLANVVSVRRTEGADRTDSGIDQALSEAEAALAAGDVGTAAALLAPYGEAASAAVSDWLASAEARAAADEVIAEVDAAAFAILRRAEAN